MGKTNEIANDLGDAGPLRSQFHEGVNHALDSLRSVAGDRLSQREMVIGEEYARGRELLEELPCPCVTVFGSARIKETNPDYQAITGITRFLGGEGIGTITGGGPGAMEAANKGAQEGGGVSVGLNIELPHEQQLNPYVDAGKSMEFRYFEPRIDTLIRGGKEGIIVAPGGFGTWDELSKAVELVHTGKIEPVPIILYNKEFWEGQVNWFREQLLPRGMIKEEALDIMRIVDDPHEVCQIVVDHHRSRADKTTG